MGNPQYGRLGCTEPDLVMTPDPSEATETDHEQEQKNMEEAYVKHLFISTDSKNIESLNVDTQLSSLAHKGCDLKCRKVDPIGEMVSLSHRKKEAI